MQVVVVFSYCDVFFFNDTATTEIYTLSLHDALPIFHGAARAALQLVLPLRLGLEAPVTEDRKSTRLNSSHITISYAVFCLKKKKRSRAGAMRRSCQHTEAPNGPTATQSAVRETQGLP